MKNEKLSPGLSSQDFINAWGKTGYTGDFSGYQGEHKSQVISELSKYYNSNHTCLEVGCGAGLWTSEFLSPNFKKVIALDILPKNEVALSKRNLSNVNYIELANKDYNCTGVEDSSVDFVFSFGVFCHLPNSAVETYINSIYNKLKPGGKALIMLADFFRHFKYSARHFDKEESLMLDYELQNKYREFDTFGGWFWNDFETISKILRNTKFNFYADVSPDRFRDCLMFLQK